MVFRIKITVLPLDGLDIVAVRKLIKLAELVNHTIVEVLVEERLGDDFVFAAVICQSEIRTHGFQIVNHDESAVESRGVHRRWFFLSSEYSL